jgi:obg-like ATPase 1
LAVLIKVRELFEKELWVKDGDWSGQDIEWLNQHNFLTAKPVVYLVNLSEDEYAKQQNKHLSAIKDWIDAHGGGPMIPFQPLASQPVFHKEELMRKLELNTKLRLDSNLTLQESSNLVSEL